MKLIISFLFILFLAGCKSERDKDLKENGASDTAIESGETPATGGNNFYDFFYKFLSDENYRSSRVKQKEMLNEKFYFESDYTIHIYDADSVETNEFDKDLFDKKIYSVISPSGNKAVNYNFSKEEGLWFLVSKEIEELKNGSYKYFIPFLIKFSKDSIYQKRHIKYPLKSSFLNFDTYEDTTVYLPEKDVLTMNFFGSNYFSFIHNGDIINEEFDNSTILLRGIGSGIYYEYKFKLINGEWFLVEEIDFST